MTPTPLSHAGLSIPCTHCHAQPGDRCVSSNGRILPLTHTHSVRWRADMDAQPARAWLLERTAWRRSA